MGGAEPLVRRKTRHKWRQLVFVWLLSIAVAGAAWAAESTAPVQAATAPVRIALRAGKLLNVRTATWQLCGHPCRG
jgi:hypothetical protein